MKNKKLCLAVMAAALIFGMIFIGCDRSGGGSGTTGSGGILTLTDIPSEYNGMYAFLFAGNDDMDFLFGGNSINMTSETFTGTRISDGTARLPMWITISDGSTSRYTGTNSVMAFVQITNIETLTEELEIDQDAIMDMAFFDNIDFSAGNAQKSWNDAW